MMIVMKETASDSEIEAVVNRIERAGALVQGAALECRLESAGVGIEAGYLLDRAGPLRGEGNRRADQARADHRQAPHLHEPRLSGAGARPPAGPIPNPHPPGGYIEGTG